jgi:hypothetical protein
LETILKSVLILAWGTFETLTEDLLIRVVEETPSLFTSIDTTKFRFTTRKNFRKAYQEAFVDDPGIMAAINGQGIDALSLIRNLLVHKSGVVDDRFKKEGANVPLLAPFVMLAIGDTIRVDGKTVLSMVDPALESGYALIEAVQAWLSSHRSPADNSPRIGIEKRTL